MNELIQSLTLEFRRGHFTLAVLSQLQKPMYGYLLVQRLEEFHFPIDSNTLYPLLRRLEKKKLLKSEWDTSEGKPRKYYVLSDQGKQIYHQLRKNWFILSQQMNSLVRGENDNGTD
jgi:PadR family transcriptional regulator, regulatory protein PadR